MLPVKESSNANFYCVFFTASYVSLESVIINPSGTIKFKHLNTGLYAIKLCHIWRQLTSRLYMY